ncbi:trichohyalin-like isoform X2 [Lineus longissimus]|uniref:trichohyalin-like isoform X2 n=1 Tax=Lineus longissimus TaxID=88925 RepID=UPI002B4F5A5F
MSFEKNYMVRFATTKNAGKTQIFWEQENQKKQKKKVNYKTRDQPHPLRSRVQQETVIEPEPAPVHKAAPAPKLPKRPQVVQQRKPPGYTTKTRDEKTGKDTSSKAAGAVTLTQEELAAILTSLGKVSKDHPLRISIDKETNRITVEEEEKAKLEKKKKKKQKEKEEEDGSEVENKPKKKKKGKKKSEEPESIYNLIGAAADDDDDDDDGEGDDVDVDSAVEVMGADDGDDEVDEEEDEEKVQKVKKKKKKLVEADSGDEEEEVEAKETKQRKKKKTKKADDTEEEDEEQEKETKKKKKEKKKKSNEETDLKLEELDASTPRSQSKPEEQKSLQFLSISEKKRLQWEKERAELKADFNPWGRPGAGAPIKDSTGELLADYNQRKGDETERGSRQKKQQVVEEQMSQASPRGKRTNRSSPQNTTLTTSPYVDQSKVPAAMRSSFAIGATVADGEKFMTTKEMEKKQWLEDLERQIEEKKMQKAGGKGKPADAEDTWADKMSNYKSAALPEQGDSAVRASTAPKETVEESDVAFPAQLSTFIRGQNTLIDPATMQELADKRRRHLEHQQAIQDQVEERQRLKREERERKIREEQEEERKLQAQRDNLQRQFEMEQLKQKKKEYDTDVRIQKLKEAMDQAQQEAMQEKHLKRIQHLKDHGHDISQLHKSFEAKYTPRAPTTIPDSTIVPGLDITPRQTELPQETDLTKFRHNSEPEIFSHRKESGVQTDFNGAADVVERTADTTKNRDNSAGIQYKGPVNERPAVNRGNKGREKKVRLRSANSAPASKDKMAPPVSQVPPRPRKPAQKPRWNQPKEQKARPMKQSEKDPTYQRRRQQSEQRRLKREQQLIAMQEANMNRIPASERGRSRSPSAGRYGEYERQWRELSPEPELKTADITPRGHRRSRLDGHHSRVKSRSPENPPSILRTRVSRSPPTHRERAVESSPASLHISSVRARSKSPPVPAVRNRLHSRQGADENSPKHFDTLGDHRGHYSDLRPSHAPVDNGDFVPFLRSSAFLDPADSQMPLPVSREMTRVEQGRKAYAQGLKPGDYGSRMEHIQDTGLEKLLPGKKTLKDPIMNPGLVKDHPTTRQDIILQQLSDIRKNLLQRQREIETFNPHEVVASSNVRSGME